jgi:hypothetical protein
MPLPVLVPGVVVERQREHRSARRHWGTTHHIKCRRRMVPVILHVAEKVSKMGKGGRPQHLEITKFPDRHFWREGYDKAKATGTRSVPNACLFVPARQPKAMIFAIEQRQHLKLPPSSVMGTPSFSGVPSGLLQLLNPSAASNRAQSSGAPGIPKRNQSGLARNGRVRMPAWPSRSNQALASARAASRNSGVPPAILKPTA